MLWSHRRLLQYVERGYWAQKLPLYGLGPSWGVTLLWWEVLLAFDNEVTL